MQHRTDSFIAAGGTTIFTQRWSPDGTPRARVVLVHGFGEHSGRYAHVAERLTGAGLVVDAFDQRGHGRSGGARALVRGFDVLAGDLALYRQELAGGEHADLPEVLLGHSMGGAVVLEHLTGDHSPVAGVVLSGPYLRNAADVAAPLRLLAPVLGRLLPGVPTQKLDPATVSRDPEVVAAYAADPLVFHGAIPAGTGATLLGAEARITAKAGRVTEPVLLLHGESDVLADVEGTRVLAGRLGGKVDLHTYPGVHHEIFNEPEQVTVLDDLVTWLDATLPA